MWGAIAGDIIGSRFEFRNHKSKEFELFTPRNYFTDDSVMTIAVAKTLREHKSESTEDIMTAAVQNMTEIGKRHPDCGYGGSFYKWIMREPKPYGSYGNGAAMRVSYAGYAHRCGKSPLGQ